MKTDIFMGELLEIEMIKRHGTRDCLTVHAIPKLFMKFC